MHPELAVSERSAQGDEKAISFRVKILESRLDMTKRARKRYIMKDEMSKNDVTLRPLTYPEVTFMCFLPELIFLDYMNVRDDIETNSGVKIPVSRSDMSI